jgi:hypothetical protein
MKKGLFVVFGLMLIAASSFAQSPDSAYVGLYADVDHTTWTKSYSGSSTMFYMWIFWIPTDDGMYGSQFKVSFPSNIITSTVTKDADVTVTLGDLASGIGIGLGTCHSGGVWYWTHKVRLFLLDAEESTIELQKYPGSTPPGLTVVTCLTGLPKIPARKATHICLNWTCDTATQGATWGAIKSLF